MKYRYYKVSKGIRKFSNKDSVCKLIELSCTNL